MALEKNLKYWEISLKNPEPVVDRYYIFDRIIVEDKELIQNVERLRDLIISYCVIFEKDKNTTDKILNEIYEIILSIDKIQYSEFVAFWKVLDISYSILRKLPNQKKILSELLKKYCSRRRKLYNKLGYSNITIQALYDSGSSRKKGIAGIIKILEMAIINGILNKTSKEFPSKTLLSTKRNGKSKIEKLIKPHFKSILDIKEQLYGYFLPDMGDNNLFKAFCEQKGIRYEFGDINQGKQPDIVLKIGKHFFIIEAKHIKESGGAQNKQIVEIIDFIKDSDDSEFIHYLSFMDGLYFNNFIYGHYKNNTKISKQKEDIETYLERNPMNYFVNTAGLREIFKDLSEK